MEICERYMVLRDGELVAEGQVQDVTPDALARFMVGHDVRSEQLSRVMQIGNEILRVENLSHKHAFRNVSFAVRRGEILGFTGLLGDGRSELFQAIFGADAVASGKVFLDGKEVRIHSTEQALELGIGCLPRNRKENGIIKDRTSLKTLPSSRGPCAPSGALSIKPGRRRFLLANESKWASECSASPITSVPSRG